MGGRGASSATGAARGRKVSGANASAAAPGRAKTDEQRLAQMDRILQKTGMDAAAYNAGAPWASRYKHDAYYRVFDEERKLRAKIEAKPKPAGPIYKAEGKTPVNSFGEATSRYITSLSYERWQRRNDKDVLRNMGY